MNNIYKQYSYNPSTPPAPPKKPESIHKTISRQIGGMKAQGSTSMVVEVDGNLVDIPKMDYVELLEIQVKQLRETTQKLEKQLIMTNNRLQKVLNLVKHDQMSRK